MFWKHGVIYEKDINIYDFSSSFLERGHKVKAVSCVKTGLEHDEEIRCYKFVSVMWHCFVQLKSSNTQRRDCIAYYLDKMSTSIRKFDLF